MAIKPENFSSSLAVSTTSAVVTPSVALTTNAVPVASANAAVRPAGGVGRAKTTARVTKASNSSGTGTSRRHGNTASPASATSKPAGKRVSLWNVVYRRRICGNSAPMAANLAKYLAQHPECEVYAGQDLPGYSGGADQAAKRAAALQEIAARQPVKPLQKRVTLWHKFQKRKVVGNAAPLEKNVAEYLRKHPEFELYDASGDKREKSMIRAVERVLGAIVTSVCSAHKQSPNQQPPKLAKAQKKTAQSKLQSKPKGGIAKQARRKHSISTGSAARGALRPVNTGASTRVNKNNVGVSLLMGIAMEQTDVTSADSCTATHPKVDNVTAVERSACEFGLLQLLAAATMRVSSSGEVAVQMLRSKSGTSSPPESPPISPMTGPVSAAAAAAAENWKLMPDLSIGAAMMSRDCSPRSIKAGY